MQRYALPAVHISHGARVRRGRRAALTAVACGDGSAETDDAGETDAQPVPGASAFQEGTFDEVPRYPGAQAASEPAVEDDVTSQTFTVAAATPQRVIDWYESELPAAGWRVVEEPGQLGAEETCRGVWRNDEQRLVVSSTRFSGFEEAGETGRRSSA